MSSMDIPTGMLYLMPAILFLVLQLNLQIKRLNKLIIQRLLTCKPLLIYNSAIAGISATLYRPRSNFFFVSSNAFSVCSMSSGVCVAVGMSR